MTKKQRTAVAAGLTAVALTTGIGVGVSNLSEPVAVEEPGGFVDAMSDLEQAVNGLVDKSNERGMTLPQTPGINDVTTGMNGMAPTKGTTRTVQIASNGSVAKGDYLKVCEEFSLLGDQVFASDDVKIVAVTSNGVDGLNCADRTHFLVAILYTQGGNTCLRVAKFGGTSNEVFTNSLVIALGVELECADIAFDHSEQQCVIWYNKDGDGWMSRVEYIPESNQIDLTWSDRWKIGGDPENICVAYDSFSNFACVCSTVLPSGSSNESQRYAVLDEMYVSASGAVVDPTPYQLTPENCPCLYGIDYSTSPTAGGWDIAYATNWYYDLMARRANGDPDAEITEDDIKSFIIHISYPKAEDGGRGMITVDHNTEMELTARNYVETTAPGYSSGDTVAIDVGATIGELGYVAMTDVVHSVYLGSKNYLFIETYGVQKDGAKPVNYGRSRPDEVYSSKLQDISYAIMDRECAIGYIVDGAVYAQIHELQRAGSVFGPAIKVADVVGYAGIVPVSGDEVACIYVSANGDGHVVLLQKTRVVAKESETIAAWAVGTALESGEAGETIRADLNYWPDEQW